jgi:hypothetical protein
MIERPYFVNKYRFHKCAFYARRQGHPAAFKQAFLFCTRPWVLLVEEDRVVQENIGFPIISHSIELLKSAPFQIYGVFLQAEDVRSRMFGGPVREIQLTSPYTSPARAWQFIERPYMYINGASVYRMANIREMLVEGDYTDEGQFANVAKQLNYTPIFFTQEREESPPEQSPAFFIHNSEYHRSTHRDNVCMGESWT